MTENKVAKFYYPAHMQTIFRWSNRLTRLKLSKVSKGFSPRSNRLLSNGENASKLSKVSKTSKRLKWFFASKKSV